MEERPLMSADDIRRLDADRAILVPERQNPLLAWRVVYFEDPVFKAIHNAQSGPLPFPVRQDPEVAALRREVSELREAVKTQGEKANFGYRAEVAGAADDIALAGIQVVSGHTTNLHAERKVEIDKDVFEASAPTLITRMEVLGKRCPDHTLTA